MEVRFSYRVGSLGGRGPKEELDQIRSQDLGLSYTPGCESLCGQRIDSRFIGFSMNLIVN